MPFFEASEPNKITIDYSRCQPVSVIAVYARDGRVKPLFVSLVDLYGNVCKTEITGIKQTKDIYGGVSFCCAYMAGRQQRECILVYYYELHTWVLENKF